GAGPGRREVGPGEAIHVEVVGAAGREQGTAPWVAPGADDRGQAGDRAHGHPAAAVALEAVVEPDQGGVRRGVAPGQLLDGRDLDAGDRGDAGGRVVVEHATAEQRD